MEEIKAVLNKYDIAGLVIIQSATHAEWLNHISPTWSCARLENVEGDGDAVCIRVRALRKDYPTKEAHIQTVAATSGMVIGFADCARKLAENMDGVAEMIGKQIGIEHMGKFDR